MKNIDSNQGLVADAYSAMLAEVFFETKAFETGKYLVGIPKYINLIFYKLIIFKRRNATSLQDNN